MRYTRRLTALILAALLCAVLAVPGLAQAAATPGYSALSSGSRGDAVEQLQARLIEFGFMNSRADGIYGPVTERAVRALQEHVRAANPNAAAEPNGIADAELLTYFHSADFSLAGPDVGVGSDGTYVEWIQARLIELGYMFGPPDGDYGPATERAMRAFQALSGLPEDGAASHEVQLRLYADDAARPARRHLGEGSTGSDVSELQQRLKRLGFMVGEADGVYSLATAQGVRALEQYMWNNAEELEGGERRYPAGGNGFAVVVDGLCDPTVQEALFADGFKEVPDAQLPDSKGTEVSRIQRRLSDLGYLFATADGTYGKQTLTAVAEFQTDHALEPDGIAGAQTLELLMSDAAIRRLKPYLLKVSIDDQKVYAYALDENDEYTRLVRTMVCSTGLSGSPTPKGTYQNGTGPGARWHYFKKFFCWAQYGYYIQGDIMFHSVLYNGRNSGLISSSVRNLGSKASHGCVRLAVEDAGWIWDNCPKNTRIIVY